MNTFVSQANRINGKQGKEGVWRSHVALVVQLTFFVLAMPQFLGAATFRVDNVDDVKDMNLEDNLCGTDLGTCTLRAAIEQSNATPGEDVVRLPAGTYVLRLGELMIEENLTIRGEGAGTITSDGTIMDGTIIDGNGESRVLRIGLDLLVCDLTNDSVLRYGGQTGRFIETFVQSGSGGLNLPGAVTLGPDDDLFVGAFLSGVHRYDGTTGNFIERFEASNTGAPLEPTDLDFFSGELLVADFLGEGFLPPGSILRFDEGTNAFVEFVPPGSGGLASPNSLAFDFTQNLTRNRFALYVTSVGPDEVLRYSLFSDPQGAFMAGEFIDTFVSSGRGGLRRARDLAFGPDGNLYVASELNDRILRYDGKTGAFIDTFVSAGSGGLDRPTDLVFGPLDENLYVISRSSGGPQEVLRFDGQTGAFIDTFIPAGRGGLGSAGCLAFESGVGSGPTVNIRGMTIQNGNSSFGGGVFVPRGSSLSLTRSIVNGNRAVSFGNGIFNEGTLNVTDSTITRNAGGDSGGGGIENDGGTVTLLRSTVDNNRAVGGGFTGGGGIENLGGTLTITNSTISGNRLTGGIASRGGGINNALGGTTNLLNVTIANNSVATGRTSRVGGGIRNGEDSTVNFANTIIDGNSAPTGSDCFGTLTSGGFNLIRNTTDCNIIGNTTGNIIGEEGDLGSLADNGGPTRTHALNPGSDAIDKVDITACPPPARDQRRFIRPIDGDTSGEAQCDIGAFEAFSSPAP